jgi:hypothetical protein
MRPKFSSWGDCEEAIGEPEAVFRPPGASSEDPATARKAEKKKRFDRSRTAPHGAMAAGDVVRKFPQCLRHGAGYTGCPPNWQEVDQIFRLMPFPRA